jgi:hypothetical protein
MVDFPAAFVSCCAKGQSHVFPSYFGASQRFHVRIRNRIRINEFKYRHWFWSLVRAAHRWTRVSHTPKITSVHGREDGYRSLSAGNSFAHKNSKQALQHFLKLVKRARDLACLMAQFNQAVTPNAAIEGICSQPLQRSLLGISTSWAFDLHRRSRSSLASSPSLKRGKILQALFHVRAVVFRLLFIVITAAAIVGALFILLFVRT